MALPSGVIEVGTPKNMINPAGHGNGLKPFPPNPTLSANAFLIPSLIAALGLMFAEAARAQTFTILYSFPGGNPNPSGYVTNSVGANPYGGLVLSGNTLYGTAVYGGSAASGTVFAVSTDGTGFTNLHSFTANDGAFPYAGLILSDNTLYGTAWAGGNLGYGTVFKLSTNGSGFTTLPLGFVGPYPEAFPYGALTLSGNTLYGTTSGGGGQGFGSVLAINTDGTGFTNLYSFTSGTDGSRPVARLSLLGNTLYGTASATGSGNGTVFKINTDSTAFATLHSFNSSDGQTPRAGLLLSGNTLYGTTAHGGTPGPGTVFKLNTDGTGFTNLYMFGGGFNFPALPHGDLVLSGNTLYGTTHQGGTYGYGTVFKLNTNGTGFTILYSFTNGIDGAYPSSGLILSDNTLYGTASGLLYGMVSGVFGEPPNKGSVFSISLPGPPQLTIFRSGTNVLLKWPTNALGFTLQSATNLVPPVNWTNVSPGPVVVSGQRTVTNPISGTRKFYRLSQ